MGNAELTDPDQVFHERLNALRTSWWTEYEEMKNARDGWPANHAFRRIYDGMLNLQLMRIKDLQDAQIEYVCARNPNLTPPPDSWPDPNLTNF